MGADVRGFAGSRDRGAEGLGKGWERVPRVAPGYWENGWSPEYPAQAMRILLTLLAALAAAAPAAAQIAVSANDSKVTLVDGVVTTVTNPPPDTVTIVDLGGETPKVIRELEVPTSIVGPPESVAIAPDGSLALVTAATKIDPADRTKTIPDDRVTVIDLKASPPAVIATLHAGNGASGVSFNPAGTLALVANRIAGTISIFAVSGRTVTAAGTVDLGARDSGPSHVAFSRDGRAAYVTRNNDHLVSVLTVDGTSVSYAKRDVPVGLKPYSIEVSPVADVAVVGLTGVGLGGGVDTVSVLDLSSSLPRVVHQVLVGQIAEGVALSPDGKYVSVTVMNGSNAPKDAPSFSPFALLRVFSLSGSTLTPVADARIGRWCQGSAWSRDSRTVVVQCAVERELQVFRFDGKALKRSGSVSVSGGPAGIRTGR